MTKLTDEELERLDNSASWLVNKPDRVKLKDDDERKVGLLVSRAITEIRSARAQLAKMGPILDAIDHAEHDDTLGSIKVYGANGVNYLPYATWDARRALSTPTDAKEDGNGE